jgi:mannose-6-phosphate isomerase-like protein (cupin superfamily)
MKLTSLTTDGVESYDRYWNRISDDLETESVAINYIERASGESIGDCYHRHLEQEEVFVVLDGTATFDTEEGDVVVETGETIRFGPGEWQRGWNRGEKRLKVLALGAPYSDEPMELRRECEACGEKTPVVVDEQETRVVYTCAECGAETGRYEWGVSDEE